MHSSSLHVTFDFKDNSFTNVGSIALDFIKGDADDDTNITFAGGDTITFKAGSTSPALTVNTTQVKVEDNQKFVAGTSDAALVSSMCRCKLLDAISRVHMNCHHTINSAITLI